MKRIMIKNSNMGEGESKAKKLLLLMDDPGLALVAAFASSLVNSDSP